jgi:hypothetical protein
MHRRWFLALSVLHCLDACVAHRPSVPSLSALPNFYFDPRAYRVDPYIDAAVALQSLGPSRALDRLHTMAQERDFADPSGLIRLGAAARMSVLCRMLFKPKIGSQLRPPLVGGAIYLGDSTPSLQPASSDWPLEPIEIVDGVPFLIVTGYFLAGLAEPAEDYLEYCSTNGIWVDHRYHLKTPGDKQKALQKLLASSRWKIPLGEQERQFLSTQIE